MYSKLLTLYILYDIIKTKECDIMTQINFRVDEEVKENKNKNPKERLSSLAHKVMRKFGR